MRVSIEHTEQGTRKKHYYLHADVQFSEAEKHIIRSRKLHALPIISGFSAPPPSFLKQMAPGLGGFGPLVALIGFVMMIARADFGALVFIGGLALWAWVYIGDFLIETQHSSRSFTVGSVLANPKIKLISDDPIGTKLYERELRDNLQNIKVYIEQSETLGERQVFEI